MFNKRIILTHIFCFSRNVSKKGRADVKICSGFARYLFWISFSLALVFAISLLYESI